MENLANNEVVMNAVEETVEMVPAEKIVEAANKGGFKIATGVGIGMIAGAICVVVAKPVVAKLKAHKKKPPVEIAADYHPDLEVIFEDNEKEETKE